MLFEFPLCHIISFSKILFYTLVGQKLSLLIIFQTKFKSYSNLLFVDFTKFIRKHEILH